MAVLAVPLDKPFEVSPDKVSEFENGSKNRKSREITEERLKKLGKGSVKWNLKKEK